MNRITASQAGLIDCHHCGEVCRDVGATEGEAHCPRCDAVMHRRKPGSLARTWALLITAVILYIPANVLPIMHTSTLFESSSDTIVSGVLVLWKGGSWDIALIVFVASVVVPVLKILVLAILLISVKRASSWRPHDRARLFQVIEKVGHWSMLDVFVVALLVALVHFKTYATVEAGPAIVAFGAVVVLTMLAAKSFDPRMIWDSPESADTPENTEPQVSHHE